ncbi:MAG: rod shape-determining protein RodA [Bacteroidetes bacterium]|nr:rod shape-determining protein RodA [Bacteroidota bacterium]
MRKDESKLFHNVDRWTIFIYILLVFMGWLNIYAAVYNEEHSNILDMSQKYGKQLLWIGGAAFLAVLILIIDAGFYTVFAYVFYGFLLLACIAVPFIGRPIKGSKSWFGFGGFGVQPAEFMKFATNLALAKFLSNVNLGDWKTSNFRLKLSSIIRNYKNVLITCAIIFIPALVIKQLQDETGLAIVFVAFIVVMFREGLSINFILIGFLAVALMVMALLLNNLYVFIGIAGVAVLWFLFSRKKVRNIVIICICTLASFALVWGTDYIYDHLEDHQKIRIDSYLGRSRADLKGVDFNVNQSKIAIGSGGFTGKGYLKGTQTKYNFVPEQDTDFIFCTVGEEWGFLGSAFVILLQLSLMIRLLFLSERQRSPFSRIYGYGVASILFFHLTVNIGMTIGMMPVIGIPLPFFSYGGSSLWSFTILLFIFIKLDSQRLLILR